MSDEPEDEELFTIDVWDFNGNVVKTVRNATFKDIDEMEECYPIDEGYTVVVEPA